MGRRTGYGEEHHLDGGGVVVVVGVALVGGRRVAHHVVADEVAERRDVGQLAAAADVRRRAQMQFPQYLGLDRRQPVVALRLPRAAVRTVRRPSRRRGVVLDVRRGGRGGLGRVLPVAAVVPAAAGSPVVLMPRRRAAGRTQLDQNSDQNNHRHRVQQLHTVDACVGLLTYSRSRAVFLTGSRIPRENSNMADQQPIADTL